MRLAIAILGALIAATAAQAEKRDGFTGPLTGYEAELLSDVWYEIREAEHFEDINWPSHGLNRAPASPEAQQFLAAHWAELRREERFGDIDWDELGEKRSRRAERHARVVSGSPGGERRYGDSPFPREDSAAMSLAWGRIRQAARFDDIDWRAMGVSRRPGDRDARRLTSRYWGELRKAEHFEDIDWQKTTGYRAR